MAATWQQHHLLLALTLPPKSSGRRLVLETQPVSLVHVLNLLAHWLVGHIATVVAHSHWEQTGRCMTPVTVKLWIQWQQDGCVWLLFYLPRYISWVLVLTQVSSSSGSKIMTNPTGSRGSKQSGSRRNVNTRGLNARSSFCQHHHSSKSNKRSFKQYWGMICAYRSTWAAEVFGSSCAPSASDLCDSN